MNSVQQLARMRADAILVNTSRGGAIDGVALVETLRTGSIFGAAIDVHASEPLSAGDPLTQFASVVLTPHLAWYAEESYDELKRRTIVNVVEICTGRAPRDIVNCPRAPPAATCATHPRRSDREVPQVTTTTAMRWTATDRVEVVVADAVSPRTATLAEPLAVAVHALELSQIAVGDVVSVYGAGPIGALIALVARHAGASVVVITEPSPWRREVAASLGFTVVAPDSTMAATFAPLTDGEGADTTFDSAAHPSVAAEFAAITRVRGRIVVVGVYEQPTTIDLLAVCSKEQTVVGVRVYTSANVTRAIELIATGVLGLERFPAKSFALADVAAAFDAATSGQDCLKVLLTPLAGGADA